MRIFSVTLLLTVFLAAPAWSSTEPETRKQTTVKFIQPEKYTDFEDRGVSSRRGRAILMDDFSRQITRLAGRLLSEGQALKIEFTNIDMAGWINPSTMPTPIRVVRPMDKVVLEFNYQLLDADGSVIEAEDQVRLMNNDLQKLNRYTTKYSGSQFGYELVILERWLRGILNS